MPFRTLRPERSASAIPPPRPSIAPKDHPWLNIQGRLYSINYARPLPIAKLTGAPLRANGTRTRDERHSTTSRCFPAASAGFGRIYCIDAERSIVAWNMVVAVPGAIPGVHRNENQSAPVLLNGRGGDGAVFGETFGKRLGTVTRSLGSV